MNCAGNDDWKDFLHAQEQVAEGNETEAANVQTVLEESSNIEFVGVLKVIELRKELWQHELSCAGNKNQMAQWLKDFLHAQKPKRRRKSSWTSRDLYNCGFWREWWYNVLWKQLKQHEQPCAGNKNKDSPTIDPCSMPL